jgi:hypothetical protein
VQTRSLAFVVVVACSSGAPRPIDDRVVGSAAVATPASGPYRVEPGEYAKGDVQVRVEWPNVPAAARASPGRTACGTAQQPALEPTTTWAIPDAIVAIDVDHGKPAIDPAAHVVLADCALSPRVVLAGATLVVSSEVDAAAQLALVHAGSAQPLAASATRNAPLTIALPVAGHSVVVPLAPDGIYALAGSAGDPAWIVTPAQPYVAVTEATGQVVLRDVPVGSFTVEALVPARGGQPARTGRASVAVTANALAEVTVEIQQ